MKKFFKYLIESREEFKKITWPDKDEVSRLTYVTMVTVIVVAIFLWIVDSVIYQFIKLVIR